MPTNQVSATLHMRNKEGVFPLIPERNGVDCEKIQDSGNHKVYSIAGHKNDIAKFIAELINERYQFDLNVYAE